jgi:hypothetical protein
MKHNLNKIEKYSIAFSVAFAIVVFCFFLSLFSCSARTMKKDEKKTDSIAKTKETLKASVDESVKQSEKVDSSSVKKNESEKKSSLDDLQFEPVDPTKESSITENGETITFKNLKGKKRKQTTNEKNNTVEYVNLIKEKNIQLERKNEVIYQKNVEIRILKKQLEKETAKEALIPWWLWLLLLIILLIAGRIAWLYYKGINPFNWVNNLFKINYL